MLTSFSIYSLPHDILNFGTVIFVEHSKYSQTPEGIFYETFRNFEIAKIVMFRQKLLMHERFRQQKTFESPKGCPTIFMVQLNKKVNEKCETPARHSCLILKSYRNTKEAIAKLIRRQKLFANFLSYFWQ